MNTTLKGITSAALLVSFLAGAGLSAKPDREGPKMDSEKRLEHMQKNLNLSAEQTEQIRAIMKKYEPQREALVQKLRPLNKELFELMAQVLLDLGLDKSMVVIILLIAPGKSRVRG